MKKRLKSLTALLISASLLFGSNSGELSWAAAKSSVSEGSVVSAASASNDSLSSDAVSSEKVTAAAESLGNGNEDTVSESSADTAASESETVSGDSSSVSEDEGVSENSSVGTASDSVSDGTVSGDVPPDTSVSEPSITIDTRNIEKNNKVEFDDSSRTVSPDIIFEHCDGYDTKVRFSYTVSGNTKEDLKEFRPADAGKYSVNVVATAVKGDKTVSKDASFEYTITPVELTLTSKSASKTITDGTSILPEPLVAHELESEPKLPGDDSFEYNFTGSISSVGVSDNSFTVKAGKNTDLNNYVLDLKFGTLTVTSGYDEAVNAMGDIRKLKAVMDTKGRVKVTWKKPVNAKKLRYSIFRMNADKSWTILSEKQKKASYLDSSAYDAMTASGNLVYKVLAYGNDGAGTYGVSETPGYVQCVPKMIAAQSGANFAYIDLQFANTGNSNYLVQHAVRNKTNSETVTASVSAMTAAKYTKKNSSIQTLHYYDAGGTDVTIAKQKNVTFFLRVAAPELTINDYGKTYTVPASAYTAWKKVKLTSGSAPEVEGFSDGMHAIHFTYSKVKKATGYLIEYSTDQNFTASSNGVYVKKFVTRKTTGDYKSWYTNRKVEITDIPMGIPYYFRVTAYTGGYATEDTADINGNAGTTSEVVSEFGRPEAPTNLTAEYYEDSEARADAKLDWEYNTSNYGSHIVGYVVSRQLYTYNKTTKKYDTEDGAETWLVPLSTYTSGATSTKKKYRNTLGDKIPNGEMVEYRVSSVYYNESNTSIGEKGYILGEPAKVNFMNPEKIKFKKNTYTVGVGATLKTVLKYTPKKTTNNDIEYSLESDDVDDPTDYVKVSSSGVLTGVKKLSTSKYIYLYAKSKADPSNVYAKARIKVKAKESSGGGSGSGDSDSSSLVVCIDPGHGGSDDGASSGGYDEKDINLTIAKLVGGYLEDAGAKVYYTRTSDTYVSLTDRTDYAKDKGCNLFVSIHCNSGSSSASGTEVYYSIKPSCAKKTLASKISSAVSGALDTNNRGAKTRTGDNGDYYSVIRTSAAKGIPGLIVEHGFLTNSSDREKLTNSSYQKKAAKAEADAIINYWNK